MATKPRTKELCWRLIEKLEDELKTVSDAYHSLANDCQTALGEKDLEMMDMCKKCRRGIR